MRHGLNRFTPAHAIAVALLFGAIGMAGVFLDTAWHRTIGRDSFLILPHAFIYAGGIGIFAAALLMIDRAIVHGAVDLEGLHVHVGPVVLPFGFALTALGVVIVGLAAPVDLWWHWMYGKDTLIWAFSHLMGHFGAGVTSIGLLFAIAGQADRGAFRRRWLWRLTMLLVFTDWLHRALFVLAHYTMIPESRTPDFYPFLLAMLVPLVLVAAWRVLGPWAPVVVATMFLALVALVDLVLQLIDFERYTLTPLVVLPAAVLTPLTRIDAEGRRPWLAVAYGAGFTLVATSIETLWMTHVVGRPWPLEPVLSGLPRSVVAGALSGWAGWIIAGFLRAAMIRGGVAVVFGGKARARTLAAAVLGLAAVGLYSTYHPQRFGPPITVAELQLRPLSSVRYQESIFWSVVLEPDWWREPRVAVRSEGIIDSLPVPLGPAWCASSPETLSADLPHIGFALTINGAPVELTAYPLVRLTTRDGEHCAWFGVASYAQRASENRFVYTVSFDGPVRRATGNDRTVIDMEVIFKDP